MKKRTRTLGSSKFPKLSRKIRIKITTKTEESYSEGGENPERRKRFRGRQEKSMLGGSQGTTAVSSWESPRTMSTFSGTKTALEITPVRGSTAQRGTERPQELEELRNHKSRQFDLFVLLYCFPFKPS